MKFLTLLLGIYILILPCIPCAETDECNDPVKISVAQTGDPADHENDAEDCGPFCACFCCGHIVSPNFQMAKIAAAKPSASKKMQCLYNNITLSSDFFGNIWQPPKSS